MARRSAIASLPSDVALELDRKLRANGFAESRAISAWLTELGHPTDYQVVIRYAKKLRSQVEGAQQRAEEKVALSRIQHASDELIELDLLAMAKQRLGVMLQRVPDSEQLDFGALALAISRITTSEIGIHKHNQLLRSRLVEKTEQLAAENPKITPELLREIREKVYGIFDLPA